MIPADATTTVLLFAILFHTFILLYVICMALRPLLATTIDGLIGLAHQALSVQGIQANSMSRSGDSAAE